MRGVYFSPGQPVYVTRAGLFGVRWVRATYSRRIGRYHTVKEFGGSYSDAHIREGGK